MPVNNNNACRAARVTAVVLLALLSALMFCGCETKGALTEGTVTAVTKADGYIYYINGIGSTPGADYQYSVKQGALCRMNPDGTNRQIIVPMCVAAYQIAGDEIYLVSLSSDNEYIIGVTALDGTGYTVIDKMVIGTFQYLYGYLYYQTQEGLVRTDSRGGGKRLLDERTPTSTAFWGDSLYCTFADEDTGKASLERIALDGSQKQTVKETECFIMGRGENGIYYLSREDSVLYLLNCQSGKSTKMVFTSYAEYAINDKAGLAYCASGQENGRLVEHNMLTGDKRVLNEYYCTDLVLTDEYVYFINGSDNSFLYRTRISDKKTELVTATVPLSGRVYVIDGYIYYTSPNERSRIYRINEETLERVCIHYGE